MTQRSLMRRTLGAASIGNFGELYDFAVFSFSMPIIAALFFPGNNPAAAMLSTFAVYAVAFAARPIGALICGYLLDKVGRVKVLSVTIWLMAGGTAIIGLLPTYDSLGIAAPVILVLCRLAQGFSHGGETTGSTVYILESAPRESRGLWVGIIYFCGNISTAVVALMLLGFQLTVGKDAYLSWAWRIPFLTGGLIGVVGYWLRRNLEDPEEYQQAARELSGDSPKQRMAHGSIKPILCVAMIMALQSVAAFFLLGFMYTFLVKQTSIDPTAALLSNSVAIAVFAIFIPIGGAISDRFGRKTVLYGGALWIALVAYLSMRLATDGTFVEAMVGQVMIAIGIGLYGSASFIAAAEFFPTSFRGTGHALGYQVPVALLGGTSPLVCAWLASKFHTPLAPAWYVTAFAIATILLLKFIPETRGVDLRTSVDGIIEEALPYRPTVTEGLPGGVKDY